jgi:hypothetical protein
MANTGKHVKMRKMLPAQKIGTTVKISSIKTTKIVQEVPLLTKNEYCTFNNRLAPTSFIERKLTKLN